MAKEIRRGTNGKDYTIEFDRLGRLIYIEGEFSFTRRRARRRPNRESAGQGFQWGHLIGLQFNGPDNDWNKVKMFSHFNQIGTWKREVESKMAKERRSRRRKQIKIELFYLNDQVDYAFKFYVTIESNRPIRVLQHTPSPQQFPIADYDQGLKNDLTSDLGRFGYHDYKSKYSLLDALELNGEMGRFPFLHDSGQAPRAGRPYLLLQRLNIMTLNAIINDDRGYVFSDGVPGQFPPGTDPLLVGDIHIDHIQSRTRRNGPNAYGNARVLSAFENESLGG